MAFSENPAFADEPNAPSTAVSARGYTNRRVCARVRSGTDAFTGAAMARRYRALLWDNDGILVDTERWYFAACRDALTDVSIELTPDLYLEHWLSSSGGILELAQSRGLSAATIAALQLKRNELYQRHLEEQELPFPGTQAALAALRPHYTMGIVTSAYRHHFEAIHRRTGFLQYVDFVLAAGDYPRSKPEPDAYLAGIARTGVPVNECLAIEDTPRGLAAARAAGLDCWVIPTPLTAAADFTGATRIFASITDVAEALLPADN